jgi:hypothetical protein
VFDACKQPVQGGGFQGGGRCQRWVR